MQFKHDFRSPSQAHPSDLWFVFEKGKLLVKIDSDQPAVPVTSDLESNGISKLPQQYLGRLDNRACYAAQTESPNLDLEHFTFKDLRSLFNALDQNLILIAGLANQLLAWDSNHRFCGKCGLGTRDKTDERAKFCPACNLTTYPRLSPAVIVAVIKGSQILLARNTRFRLPFYSVLAGFVEPGETLERCVKREIMEEVGIAVQNIRYFGSQPWPFPDSLMIGFIADYAGGDIAVDHHEIMEAAWFSRDDLPPVPPKISIARQLIDWFSNGQK